MSWTYWCPHCGAGLNPAGTVIFLGEHAGRRTLIGLHPRPGTYEARVPPGIDVPPGSRWSFACPVCREDLTSVESPRLCCVDGVEHDRLHRIFFSPVAGEYATFVVSAEGIDSFGSDATAHPLELLELV